MLAADLGKLSHCALFRLPIRPAMPIVAPLQQTAGNAVPDVAVAAGDQPYFPVRSKRGMRLPFGQLSKFTQACRPADRP
jgi:hypothetical protein